MPIPEVKTKKNAAAMQKCVGDIYVAIGHVRYFGESEDEAIADRLEKLCEEMMDAVKSAFPE